MADMTRYTLIDGTKAIPINALPAEAWRPLNGNDDDSDIAKYAASVAFMYRCIDVRSAAVSTVPWQITRGDTVLWATDEPDDIAAQYEWLKPLPELIPRAEESLCLSSESYWQIERNRVRPLSLRWLTPLTMTPIWTDDGLVKFERRLGGGRPVIVFEPNEIVYIWLRGAHETTPKTSPAEAAMNAAGVLYNADVFAKQFFERGAIKPFIIGVPQSTQKGDRDEVESYFNRYFSGLKNAFRAKAINADVMKVETIGEGLESLSNSTLTQEKREDIATAMGVPHSMVLSNASNFATAEADRLNFYDTTIVPECKRIERALNEQLFDPLGLRFRYMPQEMSIYQEDEEQRAAALEAYVRAGIPLTVAIDVLGISLPEGVNPEDWEPDDPEPLPEPEPVMQQVFDDEMRKFRKWAERRIDSKNFDAEDFTSGILTSADRARVLAELQGDASGADAPFPVADWDDYP